MPIPGLSLPTASPTLAETFEGADGAEALPTNVVMLWPDKVYVKESS